MFTDDEIIKIIKADPDYRECGEYYDLSSLDLSRDYEDLSELEEALINPTKQVSYDGRLTTTTITVVAETSDSLLVKDHYSCHSGSRTQWWVFNRSSLKGDIVWEDDDLG